MRKIANEELNRLSVEVFKEAPKKSFCMVPGICFENIYPIFNLPL